MNKKIQIKQVALIGLILAAAAFITGFWIGEKKSSQKIIDFSPPKVINPTPPTDSLFCNQDSDCVVGIQPGNCCSCPQSINRNNIGADGWQLYEYGKNYALQQPEVCQRADCAPCELPANPACRNNICVFSPTAQGSLPISVIGEIVCLPHRDTSGGTTLECAYGLKAEDGLYYGLRNLNQEDLASGEFTAGQRIEITGTFYPDPNEKIYDTVGTIDVESYSVNADKRTFQPEDPDRYQGN